ESAAAPDEARQPLRAAAAGYDADRHLRLTENGAANRAEAHVEREQELAAAATSAAFDLADRCLRHRPKAFDHLMEPPQLVRFGRDVLWQLLNQCDISVRDEEFRVGALQDDDPHLRVSLQLAPDTVEILNQRHIEQVDRWMIDGDERHPSIDMNLQTSEPFGRRWHGVDLLSRRTAMLGSLFYSCRSREATNLANRRGYGRPGARPLTNQGKAIADRLEILQLTSCNLPETV